MPFFIKYLGLPQECVETLFFQIDTNGDNEISKVELYDFLVTYDPNGDTP